MKKVEYDVCFDGKTVSIVEITPESNFTIIHCRCGKQRLILSDDEHIRRVCLDEDGQPRLAFAYYDGKSKRMNSTFVENKHMFWLDFAYEKLSWNIPVVRPELYMPEK